MLDLINQLSKAFCLGRVSILCGAGISANSGIPIVVPLVENILHCIEYKWHEENHTDPDGEADSALVPTEKAINDGMRFETFIQILLDWTTPEGYKNLFSIYEGLRPNFNHRFLARMARVGLLWDIYTTNFDTLLEAAMMEEGVSFAGESFIEKWQVYPDPMGAVEMQAKVKRLVKLHGSLNDIASLRTTLQAISTEAHVCNMRPLIKRLFERQHANDFVLALGYSFSDDLDINPILHSGLNDTKELIIVNHKENATNCTRDKDRLMAHMKRAVLVNLSGELVHADTGNFLKCLWEHLCIKQYTQMDFTEIERFWKIHKQMEEELKGSTFWQNKVNKWAMHLGAADLTLAAIWHRLGDYKKMHHLAMAALKRSHREGKVGIHCSAGLMLVEAALKLGKPAEAEQFALKTRRFAKTIGATEAELKAFQFLKIAQAEQGNL